MRKVYSPALPAKIMKVNLRNNLAPGTHHDSPRHHLRYSLHLLCRHNMPLSAASHNALPNIQVRPVVRPPTRSLLGKCAGKNGKESPSVCMLTLHSNCGTTRTPLWRRSPTGEMICNACGLYLKARNQMRPVGMKKSQQDGVSANPDTPDRRVIPGGAAYTQVSNNIVGTCPGGGRCNGTGGHDGCNGCPAYNNRVAKTAQFALAQSTERSTSPNSDGDGGQRRAESAAAGDGQTAVSVIVACQNCGTTVTPLWRRDEEGHTICNACGKCIVRPR